MNIFASLSTLDWILLGIVAVLAALAVRSLFRGPDGCDSGCGGCPYAGNCQKKKPAAPGASPVGKGEPRP